YPNRIRWPCSAGRWLALVCSAVARTCKKTDTVCTSKDRGSSSEEPASFPKSEAVAAVPQGRCSPRPSLTRYGTRRIMAVARFVHLKPARGRGKPMTENTCYAPEPRHGLG